MIKSLKIIIVALVLITGLSPFFVPSIAQAAPATNTLCDTDPAHYAHPLDSNGAPLDGCAKIKTPADCPSSREVFKKDKTQCALSKNDCPSGQVDKNVNKCVPLGNGCNNKLGICADNPIVKDLNLIVNALSGLVGVVVVGMIILGGIQYSMAGDKAEAVSAAKKRIINGLTALVAFLFIFAFLQWLIPGGVFS